MGRHKGTGKKFECQNCHHCKTRVFFKVKDLTSWCGRKSIKSHHTWIEEVIELGRVRLIWCDEQTDRHCPRGFCPRNASPRHTASIIDIRNEEGNAVVITNQNKNSFIPDCPFYAP